MRTHTLADLPGIPRRFNRAFAQVIRLAPDAPLVHRAVNREIEYPYRSARSIIIRLGRWGLVLGRYGPDGDEDEALRRSVILREPTREELDAHDETVLHGPGFSPPDRRPLLPGRPRPGVGPAGGAGARP